MLLLILLIARLRLSHQCDLILQTVFYASELPFVESDVAPSSPTKGCRRFSVYSRIEYSSASSAFSGTAMMQVQSKLKEKGRREKSQETFVNESFCST